MASTYSDLKIELIGTGEQSGTWGSTTNTNLGTAISEAITGSATVTFSSADETLTLTNTNASQAARNLRIVCTGTSGGARNLILGSGCQIEKLYIIQNDLADTVTVKNTTGTGVAVLAGTKAFVYNDGTNVIDAVSPAASFDTGTRMIFAQTAAPTGWTKDTSNYNNHALRVVTGTASTGGTVDFTSAFVSQSVTGTVSTSVTANTGQVVQGGNVSSSGSTGQVVQGGNISVSTGQAAGSVSVGNTTLAVPTIPSHRHSLQTRAYSPSTNVTPTGVTMFGPVSTYAIGGTNPGPLFPGDAMFVTGGSGAHTHPGSGGQHAHPASGTFTGSQHAHPVSVTSTFSGAQHAHPVSAPASSNFSGTAINLAVKYLDVITATKD
jgi:hypothetical protein